MVRIDLHCHSVASTEADEAVLNAIQCPECYSEPDDVYAQATRRGMDFVTITDHDSINGVAKIAHRPNVLVGEELTCYFPEDHCKMHVLVWGITAANHAALQERAEDIYAVAEYMERHNLAHAVAHPLYRQNDKLERWHLERLLLMFKGFECLNGAHSVLHRDAFTPVVDNLSRGKLETMAIEHGIAPRWPEPWNKVRTGGSDDHGLFNIGRTWTEFPADVQSVPQVLDALRTGRCRPGGEAGSSLKLAHNFYGVGIRYYTRTMAPADKKPTVSQALLQMLVGERKYPRKREMLKIALKSGAEAVGRKLLKPFKRKKQHESGASGTAMLGDLFLDSFRRRAGDCRPLVEALKRGEAPLGEHAAMFQFISGLNRDITRGIVDSIASGIGRGELAPVFDALSAVAAQQFVMLPYYFALFHQNRERHLFDRITATSTQMEPSSLRVGLFTDTFDEVNGVGRFLRRIGQEAHGRGRSFTLHTCSGKWGMGNDGMGNAEGRHGRYGPIPHSSIPHSPFLYMPAYRRNFEPLASVPLPYYPEISLSLPPLAEVMEHADRGQFDAVHLSTPGPMGLCGLLVARMLNVPVLATYHTDFPAFVQGITGDHRLTGATAGYMRWFYGQCSIVFARSREYEGKLRELGVPAERIRVLHPGIDTVTFNPGHRDVSLWERLYIPQKHRLLYVGRVSAEKNLALLVESFKQLAARRNDVALVVAGDGPYLATMKRQLAGLPAHFLGYQKDDALSALYASSDLFVFPSRTDTLGQAVIEAQASGLPVLVSDIGGPKEVMDDGVTGMVLSSQDSAAWATAIDELLSDSPRRLRMARTAPQRVARFNRVDPFDEFWSGHVDAARAERRRHADVPPDAAYLRATRRSNETVKQTDDALPLPCTQGRGQG